MNKNQKGIAHLLILLLVIIGIGAAGYLYLTQQKSTEPSSTQTPQTGTSEIDTSNWKTYNIQSAGISFKLPPNLKGPASLKEELLPGEKGDNICFKASYDKLSLNITKTAHAAGVGICGSDNEEEVFLIGGKSIDFEAGRGGVFTDLRGYKEVDGKYYPGTTGRDIPQNLITRINNPNHLEIIKVIGDNYDEGEGILEGLAIIGTPGSGNVGALINTNSTQYPGLAVKLELDKGISEQTFDQILSTFRFLNNSTTTLDPNWEDAKIKGNVKSIRAALELYRADFDIYPPNLQALVDNNYLTSIPTFSTIKNELNYQVADNQLDYTIKTTLVNGDLYLETAPQ